MERDNYTCRFCKKRGIELCVDHIIPFSFLIKKNNIQSSEDAHMCQELWETSNGRTLCLDCHRETDTYSNRIVHWERNYQIL